MATTSCKASNQFFFNILLVQDGERPISYEHMVKRMYIIRIFIYKYIRFAILYIHVTLSIVSIIIIVQKSALCWKISEAPLHLGATTRGMTQMPHVELESEDPHDDSV